MIRNTLRFAAFLAIVATVSACSSSAENPLAPETTTGLTPGAAALSLDRFTGGNVRPPGDGEIETLGYTLGWP